ncbi:transporter substrate-binding protein [Mesorhizobium marinum]|uniref:transporter substrate-binding protein n=1 Tax=Mesorhizobium marinum TaxID=3228790 RepID=UPI003466BB0E
MKLSVRIGVLYSHSGTYSLISDACREGVLRAITDVNADAASPIELVPVQLDPQGNVDRYAPLCEALIREHGVSHIVGCVTSWSRKEVIPVLEKYGAALWYACPYEGFEANEHIVYMHACPNQHLVPLLGYVVPRFGANGLLLGSNYIWGWETNRVARDLIADAGGAVLAERYLPIGETDVSRLIEEIRATRPNFIFNNLIGTSSYAFIAAYAELGRADPHFRPDRCPLLSCNLTESELPAIGDNARGHLSAGPYFRATDGSGDAPDDGGRARPASSFEAAAYASVRVLAKVLEGNPQATFAELPAVFAGTRFQTPFGETLIDPQTQHATLPVVIGQIGENGFETVSRIEGVAPDPYLSRYDRTEIFGRPRLKVVS